MADFPEMKLSSKLLKQLTQYFVADKEFLNDFFDFKNEWTQDVSISPPD